MPDYNNYKEAQRNYDAQESPEYYSSPADDFTFEEYYGYPDPEEQGDEE